MTENIEVAAQQIRTLAAKEIGLLNQQASKIAEAATAEQAAGAAYLQEDDPGGDHLDRAVRLQAEAKAIGLGLAACRVKRLQAVQSMLDGEIQELRERSVTARADAENITGQAAPLLEQLRALERCDHLPQGQTESARLTLLAGMLQLKADERARKGVAPTGNVQLDGALTAEQIVRAVLEHPSDCPTADQLFAWVTAQDQHAQFATHRINVHLAWTGSQIDRASRIQVLESLTPPAATTPVEPPTPIRGRLSVDQLFGHASRPQDSEEQEQSA